MRKTWKTYINPETALAFCQILI